MTIIIHYQEIPLFFNALWNNLPCTLKGECFKLYTYRLYMSFSMNPTKRGRPKGTTGKAAVLSRAQIKTALRMARSRPHLAGRSTERAKELAALRWVDVFDANGALREVLHFKAAYTKGAKTRDVYLSSPKLRHALIEYRSRSQPRDPTSPSS
jgi:hypothetical protein